MLKIESQRAEKQYVDFNDKISNESNSLLTQIGNMKIQNEETQELMLANIKELILSLKKDLDNEITERETTEENLLNLLEETCNKLCQNNDS